MKVTLQHKNVITTKGRNTNIKCSRRYEVYVCQAHNLHLQAHPAQASAPKTFLEYTAGGAAVADYQTLQQKQDTERISRPLFT